MRLPSAKTRRRAASLVEAVIVLTVFLTLILGMIDLGMGVFQSHVLSEAARQGARKASVHGSLAPASLGSWGPATYGPQPATDSNVIAQTITPFLAGIDPSSVQITVTWLDSSNDPDKRVRVTLTYTYHPMTTFVFTGTFPLTASSTMPIAH